jgi:transposase-like protein
MKQSSAGWGNSVLGHHIVKDLADRASRAISAGKQRRSTRRIARGTVEEALDAMLEAEADRLCNAGRYERTQARRDQRSGSYDRQLQTKADSVTLKVPKLRRQTSRRRSSSAIGGGRVRQRRP